MCTIGLVVAAMLAVASPAAADVSATPAPSAGEGPNTPQPNPLTACLAHARQEQLVLNNIYDVFAACPSSPGSPTPAGPRAPSAPTSLTSQSISPTGKAVYVCGTACFSGPWTVHASGCAIPTNLIIATQSSTCDAGANELWTFNKLSNGYEEIAAYYGGHIMCANVKGGNASSGTQIIAWGCDSGSLPANEQWRQPENTPDHYYDSSCANPPCAYFIVPSQNYGLTWNVQGGISAGHNIILYGQSVDGNDAWSFYQ
jgi:hypothetical protein